MTTTPTTQLPHQPQLFEPAGADAGPPPRPARAAKAPRRWFNKKPDALVLHLDVDAFFASVEQLLIPMYRDRPVAVGNGVIASCSYEARAFGLRAGTPLHEARRLCPQLVILDGHYPIYRCFAEHIWQVARRYVRSLETFLDEAYGDAAGIADACDNPDLYGRRLQDDIRREVGLPVSVGLGANRMMAKIASSSAKPGGVRWIPADKAEAFLAPLPLEKLPGIGRKTARILHDMNLRTIADFRRLARAELRSMFGQRGEVLYDRARGLDVKDVRDEVMPKSISRETTFHQATADTEEIRGMLFYLLERAMRMLRAQRLQTRCLELTLCYDDWRPRGARRSLPAATDCDEDTYAVALDLLAAQHTRRVALRRIGVVLSSLSRRAGPQLFEPPRQTQRRHLHEAVDAIRDRWGHASVVSGESIGLLGRLKQDDYGFVLRTPSLTK